ncbi:hypothetical protein QTP88_012672 [Uroleucon formosanum]
MTQLQCCPENGEGEGSGEMIKFHRQLITLHARGLQYITKRNDFFVFFFLHGLYYYYAAKRYCGKKIDMFYLSSRVPSSRLPMNRRKAGPYFETKKNKKQRQQQ